MKYSIISAVLSAQLAWGFSGEFDVVAVNVAGLPALLSSSKPSENTPEIGRRISNYSIVNVQEDFNYHAALYDADTHPYRTSTSGGVPFGSGLNTLSKFPITSLKREAWKDTSINSGDGLTPKGWTMVRARLEAGVYVDIYNLHTDAGDDQGDLDARSSNLEQVRAGIEANSANNAVIVFGDTNSRYTRDTIRTLTTAPSSLTDSWIQLVMKTEPALGSPALVCPDVPDNNCEVVDKIFYRGSRFVNLVATEYNNDHAMFLNAQGETLSDHDPIRTAFTWTTNDDISPTDLFGGEGGTWFSDMNLIPAAGEKPAQITSISITAGKGLIVFHTSFPTEVAHGAEAGAAPATLDLEAGESLIEMMVHKGEAKGSMRIFALEFRTSTGRTLSAGSPTPDTANFTVPAGFSGLVGFQGAGGKAIDMISGIWGKY